MKIKELNFKKLKLTSNKKNYVFRNLKGFYFKEPMTIEEAKKEFIKQLNEKGYVPLDILSEPIQNHFRTGDFDPHRYGQLNAWCCYFGKRNAPKIGFLEQSKEEKSIIRIKP